MGDQQPAVHQPKAKNKQPQGEVTINQLQYKLVIGI